MDLLARREHSLVELRKKLLARGFEPSVVNVSLRSLESDGLVSDARFAESFVRSRIARGQGPVRIRLALRERGVPEDDIEDQLAACGVDWNELADRVRRKRFGPPPEDVRARSRQARFLQYRGFTSDQIHAAFTVAS
ncbi:recombination regulator RecX [soil metagenome]